MSKKVFIAPRLVGCRFEDHTLPVNILEDFTALEDLIIEVAKGIYIAENSLTISSGVHSIQLKKTTINYQYIMVTYFLQKKHMNISQLVILLMVFYL